MLVFMWMLVIIVDIAGGVSIVCTKVFHFLIIYVKHESIKNKQHIKYNLIPQKKNI